MSVQNTNKHTGQGEKKRGKKKKNIHTISKGRFAVARSLDGRLSAAGLYLRFTGTVGSALSEVSAPLRMCKRFRVNLEKKGILILCICITEKFIKIPYVSVRCDRPLVDVDSPCFTCLDIRC